MSGHADFARWCESEGIDTVVAGAGDVHGIWRGKRLPLADFMGSDVVLVLTHSEDTDEGQELVEPPGGAAYPLYFPRKEQGFPQLPAHARRQPARRCNADGRALVPGRLPGAGARQYDWQERGCQAGARAPCRWPSQAVLDP